LTSAKLCIQNSFRYFYQKKSLIKSEEINHMWTDNNLTNIKRRTNTRWSTQYRLTIKNPIGKIRYLGWVTTAYAITTDVVQIAIREMCTTLCHKVCQWLATGRWVSPGTPVSSINKTEYDITEILLKVVLNTLTPTAYTVVAFIC
jgi:hypothetical protein